MKLRIIFFSLATLMLGGIGSTYALGDSYYPPERIHCKLNNLNQLSCKDFNREYLVEHTTNANFVRELNQTFYFTSAVAYFTPNQTEATIFFTYRNSDLKVVRLKTRISSIKPDLNNGNWKKFNNDFYTCDAAYMQCRITDLPG